MTIKKIQVLDNLRAQVWTSRGHRVLLCLSPNSGFTANDLLKKRGRDFAESLLNRHIRRAAMKRYPNGSMSITVFRDKVYYGLHRYSILSLEKIGYLEWHVVFVDGTAGRVFMTDKDVEEWSEYSSIFTTDIENTWKPYIVNFYHIPMDKLYSGVNDMVSFDYDVYDMLKHGEGRLPSSYIKASTCEDEWDPFDMSGLKPSTYHHLWVSGVPVTIGNLGGDFPDWRVIIFYKEKIRDPMIPVHFVGPNSEEYVYFPETQEFDDGKEPYNPRRDYAGKLPPEDLGKAIREYCANPDNLTKLREEYYKVEY